MSTKLETSKSPSRLFAVFPFDVASSGEEPGRERGSTTHRRANLLKNIYKNKTTTTESKPLECQNPPNFFIQFFCFSLSLSLSSSPNTFLPAAISYQFFSFHDLYLSTTIIPSTPYLLLTDEDIYTQCLYSTCQFFLPRGAAIVRLSTKYRTKRYGFLLLKHTCVYRRAFQCPMSSATIYETLSPKKI